MDEVNKVFAAYIIAGSLICLLIPDGLGIAANMGWDSAHIPIYSWIADVRGVLPFYRDYFALMWALLPLWLLAYGVAYARTYSSEGIHIPLLIAASVFLDLVLALIIFGDIKVEKPATSRALLVALAAKSRLIGAFLFPGMMMFVFGLCSIALVKTPIDIFRRYLGKGETE